MPQPHTTQRKLPLARQNLLLLIGLGLLLHISSSLGCSPPPCQSNQDCYPLGFCVLGNCRQCKTNSDCPANQICNNTTFWCVNGTRIEANTQEHQAETTQDTSVDTLHDAGNPPTESIQEQTPETRPEQQTEPSPDSPDSPRPGCTEGEQRSCYEGPEGSAGEGICKAGSQTCKGGFWSVCEGQQLPKTEVCNKIDDNCDGNIDEGCKCNPGEKQSCGSDVGACKKGSQFCENTNPPVWSACLGEVKPKPEECNGLDDNCDGSLDENISRPCYNGPGGTAGKGICKAGTQTCLSSKWSICNGMTGPKAEVCNNLDDDCNGKIDDNLQGASPSCPRQQGLCQGARATVCLAGKWQACTDADYQKVYPGFKTIETCDGRDENCDGNIDETAPNCVFTIAGTGQSSTKDGPGPQAAFNSPHAITLDPLNNLYVGENSNKLRKVTPARAVTTHLALSSTQFPFQLQRNTKGVFYFTSYFGGIIKTADPTGRVSDYAGRLIGYRDGPKAQANFGAFLRLAIDTNGNIYVSDMNNQRIRKIENTGNVTTIAGNGNKGYRDATGTNAIFNNPGTIAVDAKGQIFVFDAGNFRIRKIDTSGRVTTLAGNGKNSSIDGLGSLASLQTISGMAAAPDGTLYLLETHRLRALSPSGQLTTLNKNSLRSGFLDGALSRAQFNNPYGIVVDPGGTLYIADTGNHKIRRVNLLAPTPCPTEGAQRSCYTQASGSPGKGICKNGSQTCNAGLWTACLGQIGPKQEECNGIDDDCNGLIDDKPINPPSCTKQAGVCAGTKAQRCTSAKWQTCNDADYTAQQKDYSPNEKCDLLDNNCDDAVDNHAPACATPFAGTGSAGYTDGKRWNARFLSPHHLAISSKDEYYISDNNRIRAIDTLDNLKTLTTLPAVGTSSADIGGLAVNTNGTLTIAVSNAHLIYKLNSNNSPTVFVGRRIGYREGIGIYAYFNRPMGLAYDAANNLYVADNGNHRIRKITPSGQSSLYAGNGNRGSIDGPGTTASFNDPVDIAIDPAGNLYVAESDNRRIRKIDTNKVVSTIALLRDSANRSIRPRALAYLSGKLYVTTEANQIFVVDPIAKTATSFTGSGNGYKNGPLPQAQFNALFGIVANSAKELVVVDNNNRRLRRVSP